jgi:hypothetical protein
MERKDGSGGLFIGAGCFPFAMVDGGGGAVGWEPDRPACCPTLGKYEARESCPYEATVRLLEVAVASVLAKLPEVLVESCASKLDPCYHLAWPGCGRESLTKHTWEVCSPRGRRRQEKRL